MNFKRNAFLLVILLCPFFSIGQSPLALPQIENYSYDDYKGGIQNWDVAQDKNGILYFGNNDGLLTFNGSFWNLHQLPNFTVVRSVEIDAQNRIFIGGQDEIGYFFPNKQGRLTYHSLMHLIPENERKIADVWNVEVLGDEVFFRSINKLLHYKDDRIIIYQPKLQWAYLGKANNNVYAQGSYGGLLVYNQGSWKPVNGGNALHQTTVTSILPFGKDSLLISTLKNGLFLMHQQKITPFKTTQDQTFFNDRIYCAAQVNKDWYALGTTSAGILIINKTGQLVQRYSFEEGLQKNNIRGMLIDHNRSLWVALDDGIDQLSINSAIKTIFPDKNKQATGYAVNLFKDRLYIGTSNGLYASPVVAGEKDISFYNKAFTEVKNAKGQVWSLEEINGQLLMGHEDGNFVVSGNEAERISSSGTWLFRPVSRVYPVTDVLAGTYFGLQHLRFQQGKFVDQGALYGFNDSFRFLDYDAAEHTAWASHPNRGIYKLQIAADFNKIEKTTIYGKQHGLPSNLHNYLFHIKNRRVVATEKGIYEFDVKTNSFKPSALFKNILEDVPLQYLKEDRDGKVWFVSNKRVGVLAPLKTAEAKYSLSYLSELNEKVVGGFESIYVYNEENVFFGGSKGIFHLNYKKYKASQSTPTVLLGQVKSLGETDSLIFGGYFLKDGKVVKSQDKNSVLKLPYGQNSMHFEYSSTLYDQKSNVQYSYQLEGFDPIWSQWTAKSEKDYTNLPAGKYTFKVRSRNNLGNESAVVAYEFRITPAWYRSMVAYVIYFLIGALTIYLVLRWQKLKHLKEQEHLSYLHQLEVDRNEKEITNLQNEKLEAEMDFKNRELATMTMNLVQRGEVLTRIKEVITTLVKKHDVADSSQSFRHLLRLIRDVEKGDDNKTQFNMHFNNVNEEFFNTLKDLFPEITPNELKLCAYLKLNLSTKEIAQMMNITIKAVEVARYRLRKKLNIRPDINLYDFLMQVSRGLVLKE